MYLARLTDQGELRVCEIDPLELDVDRLDKDKVYLRTRKRAPKEWRFTGYSGPGWAAIRDARDTAIAVVHALREHREAA